MGIAGLIAGAQRLLPRLYAAAVLPGGRALLPPLHAYFEITYRCNLRCRMCHFLEIIEDTESRRLYRNELDTERMKKVIAGLPRFSAITLTGGEALMKEDFAGLLEFAATRRLVHVITNGLALDSPMTERLTASAARAPWGPGVFFTGVSILGAEETHDRLTGLPGSYERALAGLRRLVSARKRYPLVHLTCVILPDNAAELSEVYEIADRLGVEVCNFVLNNPAEYVHRRGFDQQCRLDQPADPVAEIVPELLRDSLNRLAERAARGRTQLRFSPNGITPEEIVRYYSNRSDYRSYRCRAPWGVAGISAYGDVWSCPHVPAASLGDDGSFDWNAPAFREFRMRMRAEKIFPGCLGCCQSEYVDKRID